MIMTTLTDLRKFEPDCVPTFLEKDLSFGSVMFQDGGVR